MKKNRIVIFLAIMSACFLSCGSTPDNTETPEDPNKPGTTWIPVITVNFQYGVSLTPTAYKNIYVVWIENESSTYIQNIYVCKKLIDGGLTGIALPYWKLNKYPVSVDAVSSATKANTDFTVSVNLRDTTIRRFTVYFETDRSYDPNDWFSDQPAILYAADIDIDNLATEYELTPIGWTPNDNTANVIANTPAGVLQREMRYITNLKDGTSFGAADSRSATRMVKKITVTVK